MANSTPIITNHETLIAYVSKDHRRNDIQGLAYYAVGGNLNNIPVIYRHTYFLEDPDTETRVLWLLPKRIEEAKKDLDRDNKKFEKIEGSLAFIKKEFSEKGPVLTVPLVLSDNFVGYPSGTLLTRRAKDRYFIIKGMQEDSSCQPFEPTDGRNLVFYRKDKIMKEAKKYLDATKTKLQESISILTHNVFCWENNLHIIQNRAYVPPF